MSKVMKAIKLTPQQRVLILMKGRLWSRLTTAVIIASLFLEDLRVAAFPKTWDDVFFTTFVLMLFVFGFELMVNSWARPGYFRSTYFWLDLLATLSLIPDIGWFWQIDASSNQDTDTGSSEAVLRTGRVSRIGTQSGRIVRLIRIIRVVRISKLLPKLVACLGQSSVHQNERVPQATKKPSQVGKKITEGTTQKVIVLILAMLLFVPVFELLVPTPGSDFRVKGLKSLHQMGRDPVTSNVSLSIVRHHIQFYDREAGKLLHLRLFQCSKQKTTEIEKHSCVPPHGTSPYNRVQIDEWIRQGRAERPTGHSSIWYEENVYQKDLSAVWRLHRPNEIGIILAEGCHHTSSSQSKRHYDCYSIAYFNEASVARSQALGSLLRTLLVILTMSAGIFSFTRSLDVYLIGPIERMTHMLKQLSRSSIGILTRIDKYEKEEEDRERQEAIGIHHPARHETNLIADVLTRAANLLQLGFGEAGAHIVRHNLTDEGVLNPIAPGRKVHAIFGFCDIRRFTDITECLQEDVMTFVNQIGHVIHTACDNYGGAANKNIGDAFLMCWKVKKSLSKTLGPAQEKASTTGIGCLLRQDTRTMGVTIDPRSSFKKSRQMLPKSTPGLKVDAGSENQSGSWTVLDAELKEQADASRMSSDPDLNLETLADCALAAFVQTIRALHCRNQDSQNHYALGYYRTLPSIRRRFGDNFKVQLGYGLHFGWAIEGAIGSKYKIDASYLSPHVNIASRLEAATKFYNVPLLLSSAFHRLLSPHAMILCRPVDRIVVKGSQVPLGIFTLDLSMPTQIVPDNPISEGKLEPTKIGTGNLSYKPMHTKIVPDNLSDFTVLSNDAAPRLGAVPLSRKRHTLSQIPLQQEVAVCSNDFLRVTRRVNDPRMRVGLGITSCTSDQTEASTATGMPHGTWINRKLTIHRRGCMCRSVIQAHVHPNFIKLAIDIFNAYTQGNWSHAHQLIKEALELPGHENDGPCTTLLKRMKKFSYQAPSDWEGIWTLNEK